MWDQIDAVVSFINKFFLAPVRKKALVYPIPYSTEQAHRADFSHAVVLTRLLLGGFVVYGWRSWAQKNPLTPSLGHYLALPFM